MTCTCKTNHRSSPVQEVTAWVECSKDRPWYPRGNITPNPIPSPNPYSKSNLPHNVVVQVQSILYAQKLCQYIRQVHSPVLFSVSKYTSCGSLSDHVLVNCIVFLLYSQFRSAWIQNYTTIITKDVRHYFNRNPTHPQLVLQRDNQLLTNPQCKKIASKCLRFNCFLSLWEPDDWSIMNKDNDTCVQTTSNNISSMICINKCTCIYRVPTWFWHSWR